jgi:hypothetical protein
MVPQWFFRCLTTLTYAQIYQIRIAELKGSSTSSSNSLHQTGWAEGVLVFRPSALLDCGIAWTN